MASVAGRWATLHNGEHVTAIPAFEDLDFDEARFDALIAEFQRDPEDFLSRNPRVQTVLLRTKRV